ncbi:putative pirin family protein [Paratrimastix pyriformis]|uniref:Pirin family protein n=1 Tax=Paratrimastix pyriformis TaxID=342808 RepID=A0ABQ8U4Y2_9EUKA|nr:putative pirin family protein [Paratrimastix pyriformis]
MHSRSRTLRKVIPGVQTSDGAGVILRRSLGSRGEESWADPFLMCDEFGSNNPEDYIAGFPSHPHRGFETITYMLAGEFEHRDHMGSVGRLSAGGVQWMTAGRGVIHSEMPLMKGADFKGFRPIWLNLPRAEKMKPPVYRPLTPEMIPTIRVGRAEIKVIAGALQSDDGHQVTGPVRGVATDPTFFDVSIQPGQICTIPLPEDHTAWLYPFAGAVAVGPVDSTRVLQPHHAGILSTGAPQVRITTSGTIPARFILLAARPIHEPVCQDGPFVMNTPEEIAQAFADYEAGTLCG